MTMQLVLQLMQGNLAGSADLMEGHVSKGGVLEVLWSGLIHHGRQGILRLCISPLSHSILHQEAGVQKAASAASPSSPVRHRQSVEARMIFR